MTQQEAILEVLREGGRFDVTTLRETTKKLLGREPILFGAELRHLAEEGLIQNKPLDQSGNFWIMGTNTF